jgi:hypothetical protein
MKDARFSRILLGASLLLLASFGFSKDKEKDKDAVQVFHGAIADSQCAYNVHSNSRSHDWMIKKGVQGATDERTCTQHCVKDMGGVYVLVVKTDVYRLDDQVAPEPFAGKKVIVTATLDSKPNTLRVLKIEEEK